MTYSSNLSKLRSMLAHSSVSSWCVPFSTSCRCASSAVANRGPSPACLDEAPAGGGRKPSEAGGWPSSAFSTLSSAFSARMLTLLIMSSRRLYGTSQRERRGLARGNGPSYHGGVAEMLCQELRVRIRRRGHLGQFVATPMLDREIRCGEDATRDGVAGDFCA